MSSPDLPHPIGDIVRYQRQVAALSLRQLATMVGISNPYLSQIEHGLRAPSQEVLHALADALGLDAEELAAPSDKVSDVVAAIRADPELTPEQQRSLTHVYQNMLVASRALRTGGAPGSNESQDSPNDE